MESLALGLLLISYGRPQTLECQIEEPGRGLDLFIAEGRDRAATKDLPSEGIEASGMLGELADQGFDHPQIRRVRKPGQLSDEVIDRRVRGSIAWGFSNLAGSVGFLRDTRSRGH
jgi:hypothetical protein